MAWLIQALTVCQPQSAFDDGGFRGRKCQYWAKIGRLARLPSAYRMRLNVRRHATRVHFPMDGACLEVAGKIPAQGSRLLEADERELIQRAQRGDRAAFDALVRLYDHEVLRL